MALVIRLNKIWEKVLQDIDCLAGGGKPVSRSNAEMMEKCIFWTWITMFEKTNGETLVEIWWEQNGWTPAQGKMQFYQKYIEFVKKKYEEKGIRLKKRKIG